MKSNSQLLDMYKEEKALIIGGIKERTGLEEFPSFKEWKLEYMKEYADTHDVENPMSMEEAVTALEAEIEADDDELISDEDLAVLTATNPNLKNEENEMTEEATKQDAAAEVAEASTETTAKPKSKATSKSGATKSTSTKKPGSKKSTSTKTKTPAAAKKPVSKAAEARKVFDRLYPKVLDGSKARKDVIAEFVTKANLTPAGAATYFQKFKKAYKS